MQMLKKYMSMYFFFIINIGVGVYLYISQLIPQILKFIII